MSHARHILDLEDRIVTALAHGELTEAQLLRAELARALDIQKAKEVIALQRCFAARHPDPTQLN